MDRKVKENLGAFRTNDKDIARQPIARVTLFENFTISKLDNKNNQSYVH